MGETTRGPICIRLSSYPICFHAVNTFCTRCKAPEWLPLRMWRALLQSFQSAGMRAVLRVALGRDLHAICARALERLHEIPRAPYCLHVHSTKDERRPLPKLALSSTTQS